MFGENYGTEAREGNKSSQDYVSRAMGSLFALKRNKKIIIPVIIGSIALVIVIVTVLSANNGYKKLLNNYYKAYESRDADLMYSSVVAQYWIDYMNKGFGDSAYESIQDSMERELDQWNCGEDIDITYEIKNERRATKEQLEDLEDNIYNWYAYYVYDRDEFSIADAYVLDIAFTVKGDQKTRDLEYSDGLLVIKENGKWRIPRGSLSNSFYKN